MLTLLMSLALADITPDFVGIKVFEVRVAESEDCDSEWFTIFSGGPDAFVDMTTAPTLGNGALPNGVYNCVAIKMGDTIMYKSSGGSTNCTAELNYYSDLCTSGFSSEDPDGVQIPCTGTGTPLGQDPLNFVGEDQVWVYLSTKKTTGAAAIGCRDCSFHIPNSLNGQNGEPLGAALVVDGVATGIFTSDFTAKMDTAQQAGCDLQAPVFTFEKEGE